LLFRAGIGVVLVAKRPENGQFRWPRIRHGGSCAAAQLQFFSPPQSRRRSPVRLGCVFIFKEVADSLLIFEKIRDVPARSAGSYVTEFNCYAAAH
jgi:hypothetical protein